MFLLFYVCLCGNNTFFIFSLSPLTGMSSRESRYRVCVITRVFMHLVTRIPSSDQRRM